MRKVFLSLVLLCVVCAVKAQNTFPSTGFAGIGTTSPLAPLHSAYNARNYLINKAIVGASEDSQGANYILLHKAYNGTLLDGYGVNGVITGIRGGVGGWNRKWTVEVNTASAYNTDRGSLVCYAEAARLVTLTYNSEKYLAVEIAANSQLSYFSFTGYVAGHTLELVYDQNVSNVQAFTGYDMVNVPGALGTGDMRILKPAGTFATTLDDIRGLWLQSSGVGELGVGFSAGTGASAVGFGRGTGNDTYLKFYTNPAATGGVNRMYERMRITSDGNVGIGTANPGTYKLAVEGTIGARKVKVTQSAWADFVFDPGYQLSSLGELEQFIKKHQHLPEIPTTKEVEADGVDLGEMNVKLLQKVEELTLYLIEKDKQVNKLTEKLDALEKKVEQLTGNK